MGLCIYLLYVYMYDLWCVYLFIYFIYLFIFLDM